MKRVKISPSEMQLRDVVYLEYMDGTVPEWGFTTVVGVSEDTVKLFRPYVNTEDFFHSWKGVDGRQVIHYVGYELFEIPRCNTNKNFMLVERRECK